MVKLLHLGTAELHPSHSIHLGKGCAAVSQQHDLAISASRLAPGVHDEGVVDGGAGNGVYALALELIHLLNEAWEMLGAAGWCEGAWHPDQDDLQGAAASGLMQCPAPLVRMMHCHQHGDKVTWLSRPVSMFGSTSMSAPMSKW